MTIYFLVHQYPFVSMNIHEYLLISMNIYWYPWISANIHEYLFISMIFLVFEYLIIYINIYCIVVIISHQLSAISSIAGYQFFSGHCFPCSTNPISRLGTWHLSQQKICAMLGRPSAITSASFGPRLPGEIRFEPRTEHGVLKLQRRCSPQKRFV